MRFQQLSNVGTCPSESHSFSLLCSYDISVCAMMPMLSQTTGLRDTNKNQQGVCRNESAECRHARDVVL